MQKKTLQKKVSLCMCVATLMSLTPLPALGTETDSLPNSLSHLPDSLPAATYLTTPSNITTYSALGLTLGNTQNDINFTWYSPKSNGSKSFIRILEDKHAITTQDGITLNVEGTYADSSAISTDTPIDDKFSHKVNVTGLKPNTSYTYQLSNDGDNWSCEYPYQTGSDDGTFKFAFVGDPQLKEGQFDQANSAVSLADSWANTLNAIEAKGADFIASAGDQIEGKKIRGGYKTNETEYASFFSPEQLHSIPYMPVVGNHDINYGFKYHFNLPNEQEYALIETFNNKDDLERKEMESAGNYFYQYDNALFVVLNDSAYPCDSTNNYEEGKSVAASYINEFDKTFKAAISAHPDYKWLFVQHHKSTETTAQHAADYDVQSYVDAGLEKLMDQYDVDFVFAGHDHVYSRSYVLKDGRITNNEKNKITNPNGTVYFTGSTATGKEYYDIFSAKAKSNDNYPILSNGLAGSAVFKSGILPLGINVTLQDKKPEYTMVDVTDTSVTFNTYTNDSDTPIDTLVVEKEAAPEGLKVALVSDTHLYSKELGTTGAAFEAYIANDRKMIAQSEQIVDEALARVKNSDSDIVLISGDLTKDGERTNHELLASKLALLEQAGKKVFVINGNHDVHNANSYKYNSDGTKESIPTVGAAEFKEIYKDFGYSEALSQDPNSLSYVVDLNNEYRLLVIDSCIYSSDDEPISSQTAGRIKPATLGWIKSQVNSGSKQGKKFVAMMHHGVIAHTAIQPTLFPEYLVADYENIEKQFADLGIAAVFTGHFHSNDISMKTLNTGRKLYDIETGSNVTYPSPIRFATIGDDAIYINTEKISSVAGLNLSDLNAKDFNSFSQNFLLTGLSDQVEGLFTSVLMSQNPNLTQEEAFAQSQQVANSPIAPQLTVKTFLANCMALHYSGEENPDAMTLQIISSLKSNANPLYQLLGNVAGALATDADLGTADQVNDNQVTLPIQWTRPIKHSSSSSSSDSSSSSSNNSSNSNSNDKTNNSSTTTPKATTTPAETPAANTSNTLKLNVPTQKSATPIVFKDLARCSWAQDSIDKLASLGIITGIGNDSFAPQTPARRGDFMVMLIKSMGLSAATTSNFQDVDSNKYYANAIAIAKEMGITTGLGNNKFNPDADISRQDLMCMVARALDLIGALPDANTETLSQFKDANKIAPYAKDDVSSLVALHIVNGNGDLLNPEAKITRAELSVIMAKAYDIFLEKAA